MNLFKKIMSHLFWVYAPLNEETSVTKKYLKILEATTTIIITIWVFSIILLLPAWFSEKHVINGHVIYSSSNVSSESLKNVLNITKEKIKQKIKEPNINVLGSLPTIYLHNNDILFSLSTFLFTSNSVASHGVSAIKRIHVRLNAEHMYTGGILNKEWLSVLITHEAVHNLMYERYGILTYMFIPRWVNEGYARYVSYDHAPPDTDYEDWLKMIKAGEKMNKYFEYEVLVRHAIEQMGYSVDELHKGEVDREAVEKSFLNWVENYLKKADKNA